MLILGVLVAVSALVGPARAHHSPAVFDQTRQITLEGTITEFRWTNPHSWIELTLEADAGEPDSWTIEMNGPTHLIRAGWTRSTVSVGDRVTIHANPLRSGEKVGKFVRVVFSDGREMTERAEQ